MSLATSLIFNGCPKVVAAEPLLGAGMPSVNCAVNPAGKLPEWLPDLFGNKSFKTKEAVCRVLAASVSVDACLFLICAIRNETCSE